MMESPAAPSTPVSVLRRVALEDAGETGGDGGKGKGRKKASSALKTLLEGGSSPRPDLRVRLLEAAAKRALAQRACVAPGDTVTEERFGTHLRVVSVEGAASGRVTRDTAVQFTLRGEVREALGRLAGTPTTMGTPTTTSSSPVTT